MGGGGVGGKCGTYVAVAEAVLRRVSSGPPPETTAGVPLSEPSRGEPVGIGRAASEAEADRAASSSSHSLVMTSMFLHLRGQAGRLRFLVQPFIPLSRVSRNSSSVSVRNRQSMQAGADSRNSSGMHRHESLKPSGATSAASTGVSVSLHWASLRRQESAIDPTLFCCVRGEPTSLLVHSLTERSTFSAQGEILPCVDGRRGSQKQCLKQHI